MTSHLRWTMAGLALALVVGVAAPARATVVKQLNLDELSERADKIFRGKVVSLQPGTVNMGGGVLPTVTYRIAVAESFKGSVDVVKNGVGYVSVTLIGDVKGQPRRAGRVQHLSVLGDVPRMEVGREYLLFMTAPSAYGLSAPVGLGQGCFDIEPAGGDDFAALNRYDNVGLFRGMSRTPAVRGAVAYKDLSSLIRAHLAAK